MNTLSRHSTVRFGVLFGLVALASISCASKKTRHESHAATSVQATKEQEATCTSTREFVTTLEYLRARKEFQMSDQDARSVAEKVSTGCSGAGARFVKTTDILTRSGLGSRDAATMGIQAALNSDEEAEAFASIFKRSFLTEYLDLDLFSAVRVAKELSFDLKSSAEESRKDFESLTDFCVNAKNLDLPGPQCAVFAQRITLLGNKFNGGIAKPFSDVFYFLKSDKGPSLVTADALRIAEQVISSGPQAGDNFISAYKYGTSKSGLGLSEKDAIVFAEGLARKTIAKQEAPAPAPATQTIAAPAKSSAKEASQARALKKRSRR